MIPKKYKNIIESISHEGSDGYFIYLKPGWYSDEGGMAWGETKKEALANLSGVEFDLERLKQESPKRYLEYIESHQK